MPMKTDLGLYILVNGREPRRITDALLWGQWMATARRHVGDTCLHGKIDRKKHTVRISTVFLGSDHGFWEKDKPPVLFETMVFGGPNQGDQRRYCTWDEAVKGHQEWVERELQLWPDDQVTVEHPVMAS